MKTSLVLILFVFGIGHFNGQTNIDTLRFEQLGKRGLVETKRGLVEQWESGRLVFNKKPGLNIIYRKDGSLYLKGSFEKNEDTILVMNGIFE